MARHAGTGSSGADITLEAQTGRVGRQRGDRGLATLEWLVIVAALTGLAALAVVLVQSRVADTVERISGSEAHLAAAVHTARAVENDARDASEADFEMWADWESRFSRECGLIAALNASINVEVVHNNFHRATGGTAFDAAAAGHAAAGDEQPATASKAQVQCKVE